MYGVLGSDNIWLFENPEYEGAKKSQYWENRL